MNQRGTTIFLTTHNIEEANLLCDRVGIINGGKIAAIDTPEGLKRTFEETQSVEISFDKPVEVSELEESRLVIRKEKLGDKWRLYTDNPDKLVKYLAQFAQDNNLIFTSMEICGASLEDAFVKLTEDKY
jgi:ABC-2 type transport system ATP-binding protein